MSLLFYRNKYINLLPPFLICYRQSERARESEGSRNKVHFRAQTSSGELRQRERLQVLLTRTKTSRREALLLSPSSPNRTAANNFAPYLIPTYSISAPLPPPPPPIFFFYFTFLFACHAVPAIYLCLSPNGRGDLPQFRAGGLRTRTDPHPHAPPVAELQLNNIEVFKYLKGGRAYIFNETHT